jgi:hypothetical protein
VFSIILYRRPRSDLMGSREGVLFMARETSASNLPGAAGRVAEEKPELWSALEALGEAAGSARPLDAPTVHFNVCP